MNRILFEQEECHNANVIALPPCDRRAQHIVNVLHSRPGDKLRVGIVNGLAGTANVMSVQNGEVVLEPTFGTEAPEPLFDLMLAMPRPKVLHRLWPELSAIGFGRIILTNAAKVEKYYFDNHWLDEKAWRPLLVEGLEQSGATRLPDVMVRRAFKPFVQDELPVLYPDVPKFVAHPRLANGGRNIVVSEFGGKHPLLAIGPEGGWTEFELELLFSVGFTPISLGDRALRTDTACIALAGALMGAYAGTMAFRAP